VGARRGATSRNTRSTATHRQPAAGAPTASPDGSPAAQRRGREGRPPTPTAVVAPDGNDVGVDPHKATLTASVLDPRGGILGTASFRVSGDGHRAMEAFVGGFGPVRRWGIEGASGLGRHTAIYLVRAGHDVRDVCPTRTNERDRARRRGKSDAIDSVKIAREVQADAELPVAFKRAAGDCGPDETTECLTLWHQARRSLLKSRQHLLNESEALLQALPEEVRCQLPDVAAVRPRLAALTRADCSGLSDPASTIRLALLERHRADVAELDRREGEILAELARLVKTAGSTLSQLRGIADRSDAELLVEVGDPRRFAGEGGFARFNGTAPLPASSAEGDGEPLRHRLNRGGNRRVNAVLHRMAVTQLRCEPRARALYDASRARGHTKKEAMRVLKRHLSNVVYRRMLADLTRRLPAASESSPQAA
jgi:transposase